MYADRIFATYRWMEQNMKDPDAKGYQEVELSVTVEIVSGEVVDIIYQIFPIENDTILRNTILADKMISHLVKSEKISEVAAMQKLEELTPLAKIVLGAKPKAIEATDEEGEEDEGDFEFLMVLNLDQLMLNSNQK